MAANKQNIFIFIITYLIYFKTVNSKYKRNDRYEKTYQKYPISLRQITEFFSKHFADIKGFFKYLHINDSLWHTKEIHKLYVIVFPSCYVKSWIYHIKTSKEKSLVVMGIFVF